MLEPKPFVPLRADPPPALATTLWTRSALVLAAMIAAVTVVIVDVFDGAGSPLSTGAVLLPHVGVIALLVVWSGRAIGNVDALVPPTRYRNGASGALAGWLWVAGFSVPVLAAAAVARIGSRFADPEAVGPTLATVAVVLVALLVAWLPFRYHALVAGRIGAPHLIMSLWFWAPITAFVGGLSCLAFAGRYGASAPSDRPIGIGGIYGLAVAVFAGSTWRAVTVFDEVIDLRWRRWKHDWEHTLAEMVAQPAPGPELGGVTT